MTVGRRGGVEIEIEDNGTRFVSAGAWPDRSGAGFGLMAIEERARTLNGSVTVRRHRDRHDDPRDAPRLEGRPMREELRIVIAEDHPLFRDGLRRALEGDGLRWSAKRRRPPRPGA